MIVWDSLSTVWLSKTIFDSHCFGSLCGNKHSYFAGGTHLGTTPVEDYLEMSFKFTNAYSLWAGSSSLRNLSYRYAETHWEVTWVKIIH